MSSKKLNRVEKLIHDYNDEINRNIPDKFKCVTCKDILFNSCEVPCGCNYCLDCWRGMIDNAVLYCPGSTSDCRNQYLSSSDFEYRANRKICDFIVKCPEETCSHECKLIKMEKHVETCEKISNKCLFSDFSCDNNKTPTELLNEQCQASNYNHSEISIELIDNMKDEIDSLKMKKVNNEIKIEKLGKELKVKSELINSVNEEMKLVKLENGILKTHFELLRKTMEKRFEEMKNENLQIIDLINKKTIEMKIEKNEIKQKLEKLKENFELKTEEMEKENQELIESISGIKIDENDQSKILEIRINEINRIIDKFEYANIDWTIDKLNERKNNNELIFSEYFTSKIKPYKLRLSFYADGFNNFKGKGCSILFYIYSSAIDCYISWPCKCDVTVSIVHKTNSNLSKSITKYCEITKPIDDSLNSDCGGGLDCPIQFDYSYCDLMKDGVILDNCFIVECFVNFK